MEKILAARGLDRRAREALRLFCDAGRQSAATPELARRVSEQLQVA